MKHFVRKRGRKRPGEKNSTNGSAHAKNSMVSGKSHGFLDLQGSNGLLGTSGGRVRVARFGNARSRMTRQSIDAETMKRQWTNKIQMDDNKTKTHNRGQ